MLALPFALALGHCADNLWRGTRDQGMEMEMEMEMELGEEIPPTPCGWHFPALLFESIFIPSLPLFLFPFGNFAWPVRIPFSFSNEKEKPLVCVVLAIQEGLLFIMAARKEVMQGVGFVFGVLSSAS